MARQVTIRIDLKSWRKIANVSIHKQFYKIILNEEINTYSQNFIFLPRSITSIPVFDSDNSNNQFTKVLDIDIDKWYVEKEKLVEDNEHIIIYSE